jgi:hypothetical protein
MHIKKHLNFTALRSEASRVFSAIPDQRQQSKVSISLHDALMSGFACMHFQDLSVLQFQRRMQETQHRNNLHTLFKVEHLPKDTQLREIIDNVPSDYLRPLFREYYLRLQRAMRCPPFFRPRN